MIPYINIGPLSIGTFGLMMWLAFVAAFFVLNADFRRRNLPADPQMVIGICALAGVAGAKLYHVLESPGELMAAPFTMLFSRTGFAWFGGFIAGLLALIYFAKRYRIPILTFLDAAAPAAAVGYAVGRIGCLLSGDGDYGEPTSLPWGMSFPHGLVPTNERVHPTPIYEFIAGMVIAYFLWKLGERVLRGAMPNGTVLAMFLIFSGMARFLVEFIRINPRVYFGMSNAQVASLLSLIAGAALLIKLKRQMPMSAAKAVPTRT
ncbi:MAG: Prolipoprotein diacylglyceryl transferase [Acidobacteriales bacterium]|nr:Prolipoprotein diacylglyceryl transferase [Terriglobales bacterium]